MKGVKIGSVYAVKVNGTVQPVRILRESSHGGWEGQNINTGRTVRIKTAQQLRWMPDNDDPNYGAASQARTDCPYADCGIPIHVGGNQTKHDAIKEHCRVWHGRLPKSYRKTKPNTAQTMAQRRTKLEVKYEPVRRSQRGTP